MRVKKRCKKNLEEKSVGVKKKTRRLKARQDTQAKERLRCLGGVASGIVVPVGYMQPTTRASESENLHS